MDFRPPAVKVTLEPIFLRWLFPALVSLVAAYVILGVRATFLLVAYLQCQSAVAMPRELHSGSMRGWTQLVLLLSPLLDVQMSAFRFDSRLSFCSSVST